MIRFEVKIINQRCDGLFINVEQLFNQRLKIILKNRDGDIVMVDEIEVAELAHWIDDHRDW